MTTSTALERRQQHTPVESRPAAPMPAVVQRLGLVSEHARAIITPLLAPGITFERVMSEVAVAIQKDAKIGECTPESLLTAVARATSTGLEIGRKVYLIPFAFNAGTRDKPVWEQRAQAITDYKGDIELAVRAGGARLIESRCFYEKEPFTVKYGSDPVIDHTPLSPLARGKLLGAYAVAKLSHYDKKILVMWYDEIEVIRQKYSKSWKGGKLEDITWYCKKTTVKQIVKELPSTPALDKLRQYLDEELLDLDETVVEDAEIEPAPASTEDKPVAEETARAKPVRDYAWAAQALFPFHKNTPNHLKRMVELPSDLLVTAAEHIAGLGDKAPRYESIAAAIQIILAAREAGTAPTPEAAPAKAAAPDPVKAAAETQKAAAKPAAAPPAPKGFTAMSREISKLLDSADRTDDEKKEILEKMDAAASVADLQKILDDLALPV